MKCNIKSNIKKFKMRRGFSIIEVLVATFLLSIVVALPLADVFIRTNFRIRRMQKALAMERDLVEKIKALPYNSPYLLDDGDGNDLDSTMHPDRFVDSLKLNSMSIKRVYNIADGVPAAGMKTVKVFVIWRDPKVDTFTHILSSVTIKNARW